MSGGGENVRGSRHIKVLRVKVVCCKNCLFSFSGHPASSFFFLRMTFDIAAK